MKTVHQKAWFLVLPVLVLVAVFRRYSLNDGGKLFCTRYLWQQSILLDWVGLVP